MGHFLGILARRQGILINKIPVFINQGSMFSVDNLIYYPENYTKRILSKSNLDEKRKEWLHLKNEEQKALSINYVQEIADQQIEQYISMGQEPHERFNAIKLIYDESQKEYIYSNEYLKYEHWGSINFVLEALYKLKEILFEDFKQSILSKGETQQKLTDVLHKQFCIDDLQMLYYVSKIFQMREDADQIAILMRSD